MKKLLLCVPFCLVTACTSTTEKGEVDVTRRQMLLVPSSQIIAMSAEAYAQVNSDAAKKDALDRDPAQVKRVRAIANRLIPATAAFRKDAPDWGWEVHVLTSPELNAYCMPGGKINFYSGIIEKLHLTDGEIAAIMGHEISHALREHGRERMSEELAKNLGLWIASGKLGPEYIEGLNSLYTFTVGLPNSRREETEADEIGLELMARAGYDPHEAVNLWRKMTAVGGSKPPELLSTHPADETRIQNLERLIPKVMPLYKSRS